MARVMEEGGGGVREGGSGEGGLVGGGFKLGYWRVKGLEGEGEKKRKKKSPQHG